LGRNKIGFFEKTVNGYKLSLFSTDYHIKKMSTIKILRTYFFSFGVLFLILFGCFFWWVVPVKVKNYRMIG
jgi:hypothetical protein